MRVMLTGGAGYIGTELVYRLSAEPGISDILVYDNLCKGNYNLFTGLRKVPGNKVRFVQADILDSRSLRQSMQGMDVVFHLAAKVETPFADQNAHDFEQTNHWGTAELVYAAEALKLPRLIYLSSQQVYGQGEVTSADHLRVPDSFYAISKMRGEAHVLRLMQKLPVQLVRCANLYGYSKNLRFESHINQLIFDAHFSNRISIHGDPDHILSYISLYRTVEVLAQLALVDRPSASYNLSHRQLSTRDVVDALREFYPGLETISVDQHIPLRNLTMQCDARLAVLLPADTTLREDIAKFRQLFTFNPGQ
ncbi:MAG: NAD-dependent epimerase/dehydratase family protein [Gammaproteobacteria bacterium]|nr:NAD-dependent epimerase/dehydratase family protein [Gammaproteobacteria bacterium]MBT5202854.1 NAD-dependent epimerase/dehydratase family protein [Gammaproteobacteria bacterium]MBT5604084.1 NAD-dependent epimerase/dehydratase family protein [Gammaproteobacteria bacterium]MBT6246518.1 NAD-dependent epimerase/dehydratase family protein [Gammaproteobacteria bacterium]